jgi:hypothetical protein
MKKLVCHTTTDPLQYDENYFSTPSNFCNILIPSTSYRDLEAHKLYLRFHFPQLPESLSCV